MADDQTPKSSGYRMPAEWHLHGGTQLHWPSNRETWPGDRLQRVEEVYADIIEALHRHETVHLLTEDETVQKHAFELLGRRDVNLDAVVFHVQPVNDVWARDCGPVFVSRRVNNREEFAIVDWEYNAWGGKYPPYDDDNRLPAYFASRYGLPRFEPGMVLEGGSIDTNGDGVLLTTESVLLNPNRNPGLSKEQIEQRLRDYLGIEKVIWLGKGLAGDDTDGHIDDLSRFLNRNTILTVISEDPGDINYETLQRNLGILRRATDQHGCRFEVETLPLPETRIEGTTVDGSVYVPASYANFYVANGIVLVPLYDDRYDRQALDLFERYFPDRRIKGIPCADLVWGQGSIHCITQQLYGVD